MENHPVLSLRTIPQINVPFFRNKIWLVWKRNPGSVNYTVSCPHCVSFFVTRLVTGATVKFTAYQMSRVRSLPQALNHWFGSGIYNIMLSSY